MSADGPGAVRRALDRAAASLRSGRRALTRFAPRPSAFAPAPDAEAAAVRAVRNLRTFRAHYAVIQWALLLASLAPRHRASMLFLMAASKGLLLYGGLLRAFPGSALLRRLLDRRLVAAVFVVLVLADLAASGALPNLLFALAAGAPVVVLHAAFRIRDDLEPTASADSAEGEEEDKERTGVVLEKKDDGDVETWPTRRAMAAAAPSPRPPTLRDLARPYTTTH